MAGRRRLLALAAALPLLVAGRYFPMPPDDVIMPDNLGHAPGQILTLSPGDAVLSNPLAMSQRVTLIDSVEAHTPGPAQVVPAGERLMHVRMFATGRLLASLPQATSYYCRPLERPQTDGFFSSPSIIRSSICFYDRDNDNVLDGAFLSEARRDADQALVPIPPTRIRIERNVPMGDDSFFKIVYAGPDGLDGNLRFDMVYTTCGRPVSLDRLDNTRQRTVMDRTFPRTLRFTDAEITVLGYDQTTRAVRVGIVRTMPPGLIRRTPIVGRRLCY